MNVRPLSLSLLFLVVVATVAGTSSSHGPEALTPVARTVDESGPGSAVAAVVGAVLDAESDLPLPGAHVTLSSAADGRRVAGTVSADDGSWRIETAPGTYVLTVSFVGFEPFELSDLSLQDGAERRVDVRLEPGDIPVNPVTITASRRRERRLDAPAAVTVLEPRQLETRTALTAADHLAAAPAVDLVQTGLVSSRVAIRGFNDALSGRLLTLVDNRIARAPSVRFTALQLIPMTDGDMEQIEIVSGPASALYGPNAANGVIHMITRSPFDSGGTRLSLAGGEQDVILASFRHAGPVPGVAGRGASGERAAWKIAAQYYGGREFEFHDPVEMQARTDAIAAGADPETLLIGRRSFDVRNLAVNGRLDVRLREDAEFVLSGGLTHGDNLEITPTGAAQVENARLAYAQFRLRIDRLFVQTYGNFLDSGDSWFLRTGERFRDESRLFVVQAQHWSRLAGLDLTYGIDLYRTVPEGAGTITGRNESNDAVTEIGAFTQAETDLTKRLRLTAAARVDNHRRLELTTFSPRLALVARPRPAHSFRATWNVAFEAPRPNDLFTDVLGQRDVFMLGSFEDRFGFSTSTDLRAQGMVDGFSFSRTASGAPRFRSPFAPLAGSGLTSSDYIEFGDPAFTDVMWDIARIATVEGLAGNLAQRDLLDPGVVQQVSAALDAVLPADVRNVDQALRLLDLDSRSFRPVTPDEVRDVPQLGVTRTRTIELGYKGLIGPNVVAAVDLYHSRVRDFQGPFRVGTPNVFLDSETLYTYLAEQVAAALDDPANAAAAEALLPLDSVPQVGNRNGSAADEIPFLISTGIAGSIPFGTVSPREAFDPTAVILMRQNYGDVSVVGLDVSATVFLSRQLRLGLTYSRLSDNYFEDLDGHEDLALNAPRNKAGGDMSWQTSDGDLRIGLGGRYVEGYPVRSDVYIGRVESFVVLDAAVDYRIPFSPNTALNLTVRNLTDNRHREFVFVPEIGRLAVLRLTHDI